MSVFASLASPAEASQDDLRLYIDSLYASGLKGRSVARHLTTLRNLYKHLIEQSVIEADPSEFLAAPKQGTNLPKYLNRQQIETLLGCVCEMARSPKSITPLLHQSIAPFSLRPA